MKQPKIPLTRQSLWLGLGRLKIYLNAYVLSSKNYHSQLKGSLDNGQNSLPLDGGGLGWGWQIQFRARHQLLCHPPPNPFPSREGVFDLTPILGTYLSLIGAKAIIEFIYYIIVEN